MRVFVSSLLAGPLIAAAAVLALISSAVAADPPALKLLFLGDNGHHRPADRFAQLAPPLAQRNIALRYLDDPAIALTPETLAGYDGLVLYANLDQLAAAQETASRLGRRMGGAAATGDPAHEQAPLPLPMP